jgi:hypothetical protein
MNTYRICKFDIARNGELFCDSTRNLKKCQTYIDSVDFILTDIPKEDSKLIKDITLNHKPIRDLGYSMATYYSKFRHAANIFLRYFE